MFRFFVIGLRDRILGSKLGMIWIVLNPILMLSIFTYVFGFVLKSKLPGSEKSLSYVIWLISGYGPWLAISESIVSGTSSITSNSSIIKNISFKTEILPLSYSLMGSIPLVIGLIYVIILLFFESAFTEQLYFLPIMLVSILPVIVCQFFLSAGICFFLSSLNVFIRDVALFLPNLLIILLFATPIFYPITALPPLVQQIMWANPFFLISEGYREVILNHSFLSIGKFSYLFFISIVIFYFGLKFFRQLKSYFDSRV